jgi:hypothetical protein
MTDKQLAELEAKAEANNRAEQAERMAQAMKAVNEVAPQMGRISHVGLIASWDRRK